MQIAIEAAEAPFPTVPILLDPITQDEVPSVIAKQNWLDISGLADQAAGDEVHRVLMTDPEAFLYFQDIASRTDRWQRTGELEDALLSDVSEARRAVRQLQRLNATGVAKQPAALARYVKASLKHARGLRSARGWELLRRATAVVAIVVVALVGREYAGRIQQGALASFQVMNEGAHFNVYPHYATFQTIEGAAWLGLDKPYLPPGIIEGLQIPWMWAELAVDAERRVGAGHFGDDDTYWSTYSDGQIVRWDVPTNTPEQAYQVSTGYLSFCVASSGQTLVGVDDDGGFLLDLVSDRRTTIEATGVSNAMIACGDDVGGVALDDEDGTRITTFDFATGVRLTQSQVYGEVLDLKATSAGLQALVVDGDELFLVDVGTDTVVAYAPMPGPSTIVVAAVAPTGGSFAVSLDGKVFIGDPQGLQPAGYVTRDAPTSMALTASGIVIVSTSQDGTRVIDPGLHVELGRICHGQVGTLNLAVSPDGSTVACNNSFRTEIWRLDELVPKANQPPSGNGSDAPSISIGGNTARAGGPGVINIALKGEPAHFLLSDTAPMVTGNVSIVALTAEGRALLVGTDEGWVAAWDVGPTFSDTMYRVQQWRVPTGAGVTSAGWSADGTHLVVEADGVWWTPLSCMGCSSLGGAVYMASLRQPPCWIQSNLAAFRETFKQAMNMTVCSPVPEPVR